jgi:hypothetical protein
VIERGFKSCSRQIKSQFYYIEKSSNMNRSLLSSHLQVIAVAYHSESMGLKKRKKYRVYHKKYS